MGAAQMAMLYVEDEKETRELVMEALSLHYPQLLLHVAADGAAGLQLFREVRPELVVTDIRMPVMDGLAMAAEIRSLDPHVPIIALTAYNDQSFLASAAAIGFASYVLKPVDYGALFESIDRTLVERAGQQG